jgi:flagellar export protein FliJ
MFRFRLQNVLDLRERQERELASQLVNALSEQESAEQRLQTLRGTRDASANAVASGGRSVGELANLAFVLEQLDGHIASASADVSAAEETVATAKDALTTAYQDRRVLDRLRERHEETYRTNEEQIDRRAMDDIALSRFTQHDSL